MTASGDFFERRNPQAVLKHGILTRYAYYFAGRAGTATGNRVAFIDGYAGEGRYEDGNPGSPLLLASQAQQLEKLQREVKLACVEANDDRRTKLTRSLADAGVSADAIIAEPFERSVHPLLDRYANHAVFLFVDPFGLGLSGRTLISVLKRRTRGQPVDVLYHFSALTVARMGRAGLTASHAANNAPQLDEAFGELDWRSEFELVGDERSATAAAVRVAGQFTLDVCAAVADMRATIIEVRERPHHQPKYLLVLFSSDPKAHWDFADQASKAHADWLHHCSMGDFQANMAELESRGFMQLFPDAAPTERDVEDRLGAEAASYFESHLSTVFESKGSLRPIDHIGEIYGRLLGRAGVPHLRRAMKRLHKDGKIDDDCSRDFWLRTIRWVQ
jgi:three-Cys-motif partner protein